MGTQRTVEVEGQKIWTEAVGDPSKPAILLISGAGAHAHFWTDSFCAPFLNEGFYLIRYDHRDTGLSDPSIEDYDLQRLADDALEILNAYNIKKAHIVGHSMGGYIAQLLAACYPDRLLSITLISCGPVGITPSLEKPPTEEEKEILNTTWKVMLENRPTAEFEKSFEGYLGVWKRLNGSYPIDEELAKPYTQELFTRSRYPAAVHEKHVKVMEKMANTLETRRDIFSKIVTPVLIIHGKKDYLMLPSRGGRALKEALPNAQFELVDDMGHMLFNYDLEKRLTQNILSFLKR